MKPNPILGPLVLTAAALLVPRLVFADVASPPVDVGGSTTQLLIGVVVVAVVSWLSWRALKRIRARQQ